MLKDNLVVLTEEEYEALEARKPQVPAEVIALVYEGIDEVRDAMAAVPLSGRMSDERQEVDRKALAGFRLAVQSYTTCVEALLEFSLLHDELGLPQPECDEEASGSAPAPEGERLTQARKQVPAEVIARTQGALIGWQNADEFDADELQEHGDVLRDATRALLAAVEAAPALEARKPQVDAEVIAEARASLSESLDAWGAAHRLAAALRNLLAAVEAAPDEERLTEAPAKHRFAEWCGENFAAIWYEFSLLRDELGLPQPECDEEAS